MRTKDLYYIERHASGKVGNCLLFWKEDDRGYTCNLSEARVFSYQEATALVDQGGDSKYTAWNKKHLDSISCLHVDCQKLRQHMKLI